MELSGTINRSITLSGSMIARGLDGRGIVSIAKTGTSGLVDTYTITYTDETTSTFTVTNGANGQITATSFAEEFSSSKAYAAGDYVVYSGQLYQFTTAHAAGAWNASHATAVQIADQVSELKSAINYRTPNTIKYRELDIVPGSVLAANGTDYDDEDTVLWYRRNETPIYLKKDTVVNFLPHYRGRVFGYSSKSISDFNNTDSQWLAGTPYTIPTDAYYRIVIGLVAADWPTRNIADWQIDGVEIYWGNTGKLFADMANQYFQVSKSFVNGEPFTFKRQAIYTRLINITLPSTSIAEGLTARQDFAIYGNTLVQLFSDNYCALVNLNTGSTITHFQITSGHGNAAMFGKKFYNNTDSFPLLYCFDYSTAKIYVNRITTSGATLIKTITLPATGYRFSGGVDDENNILYVINYKANSGVVPTDNGCVFSAWDISGETPTLLRTEELPVFIPVISGCSYKDGYLWVYSGSLNDDNYGIYKIDTFGNISSWYREASSSGEAEGLDFWDEENSLNSRLLFADLSLHEVFYL